MATKKASSKSKQRPVPAPAVVSSPTTTKVTTVKAVDSRTVRANLSRRLSLGSTFNNMPVLAASIAEFVGTFMLTTVIVTQQNQPIALLFALIGIVLILGGISGAHVNPAVTVAAWVTGKIRASRAVFYVVAQVLGAMLALVVLQAFISQAGAVSPQSAMLGQASSQLFKAAAIPGGKEWVLLLAELLGTVILGFAYANSLKHLLVVRDKVVAALTVSSGIFLALVIAGTVATYVRGSVILNPAAAISLQAINFSSVWPVAIYVVAATVGAILGFVLYDLLSANTDSESR